MITQSTGHVFCKYYNTHLFENRSITDAIVQQPDYREAFTTALCSIKKEVFNLYGGFNSVKDVLSLLRGEPVDLDIPQNESDEEAMAGGNGAIGVSPSVVMRFERDILPPDLGLDQDSLIYVRSLLKAYIHNKGNLANLVDNIIQTRLKKRYAPLIPSNV